MSRAAHLNPVNSKGQVERLARSYHRRFADAFGASLGVDDLEQEFWMVWHKVSQKFDPELGYKFEALLGVSIMNRAIELSNWHRRRRQVRNTVSINQSNSDEGDLQLVDILPADTETGEQKIIREERAAHLLENIDQRLRLMIEALENPPEIVMREIEALNEKAKMAAAVGASLPRRDVNLSLLTELFDLSRCSRYRLLDQMKEVMADYD